MNDYGAGGAGMVLLYILLLLYFIPAIVGISRRHHQAMADDILADV